MPFIVLVVYFLVLWLCKKKLFILFPIFFYAAVIAAVITNSITLTTIITGKPLKLPIAISVTMSWVGRLTLLLTGYCLAYVLQGLVRPESAPGQTNRKESASFLIRGLAIPLGIAFIVTVIEQFHDLDAIKKFFIDAGYSIPFMYLIFAIQGICGVFFLLNLRFYPKLSAIALLFCVMLGAVISHFKKGDPFNYAISAMQLDIKLLILLVVYLFAAQRLDRVHQGSPDRVEGYRP